MTCSSRVGLGWSEGKREKEGGREEEERCLEEEDRGTVDRPNILVLSLSLSLFGLLSCEGGWKWVEGKITM